MIDEKSFEARHAVGDEFAMKAGCKHVEDVGPQGVRYLVGRRPA